MYTGGWLDRVLLALCQWLLRSRGIHLAPQRRDRSGRFTRADGVEPYPAGPAEALGLHPRLNQFVRVEYEDCVRPSEPYAISLRRWVTRNMYYWLDRGRANLGMVFRALERTETLGLTPPALALAGASASPTSVGITPARSAAHRAGGYLHRATETQSKSVHRGARASRPQPAPYYVADLTAISPRTNEAALEADSHIRAECPPSVVPRDIEINTPQSSPSLFHCLGGDSYEPVEGNSVANRSTAGGHEVRPYSASTVSPRAPLDPWPLNLEPTRELEARAPP